MRVQISADLRMYVFVCIIFCYVLSCSTRDAGEKTRKQTRVALGVPCEWLAFT